MTKLPFPSRYHDRAHYFVSALQRAYEADHRTLPLDPLYEVWRDLLEKEGRVLGFRRSGHTRVVWKPPRVFQRSVMGMGRTMTRKTTSAQQRAEFRGVWLRKTPTRWTTPRFRREGEVGTRMIYRYV